MIDTLGSTEIDSFKLRIPYRNVDVTNYRLEALRTTTFEGGEIETENFKKNALRFENNGIKTKFAIEVMPMDNKGFKKKYLTIGLNSKLLKEKYRQGITKTNIDFVHNAIMQYDVARFDLKTMLEGFVTDLDFKTDTKATMDEFQELKKFFKINAKEILNYSSFNSKTNQGMQYSVRETKSYKTKPFVKMYHKELELKYNVKAQSPIFYKAYLKGKEDVKDLIRFETTIKNNAHMKVLGITSNTLSHFLNLEDSFKKDILSMSINTHLESNIKQIKIREGMTPLDEMLHNLIVMHMEQGMTYDRIRDFVLSTFTEKTRKSKAKSKFNQIYEEQIRGTKKDISTKNIDSILNLIGVDNDKR